MEKWYHAFSILQTQCDCLFSAPSRIFYSYHSPMLQFTIKTFLLHQSNFEKTVYSRNFVTHQGDKEEMLKERVQCARPTNTGTTINTAQLLDKKDSVYSRLRAYVEAVLTFTSGITVGADTNFLCPLKVACTIVSTHFVAGQLNGTRRARVSRLTDALAIHTNREIFARH